MGGVDSGESAFEKITAGADAIQLYTGMVYRGPRIASKISTELIEKLDKFEKLPFGPIISPKPGPTFDIDVAAPEIADIKSKVYDYEGYKRYHFAVTTAEEQNKIKSSITFILPKIALPTLQVRPIVLLALLRINEIL